VNFISISVRRLLRDGSRVVLIGALLGALSGCALLQNFQRQRRAQKEKNRPPAARALQHIGDITLVATEGAFVLIDNQSRPSPAIGAMVHARSPDGRAAELRVTEMRKRPFVVADVVSGTPAKGDRVFQ